MVVIPEESHRGDAEDPHLDLRDEEAEETLSLCDLPIYSDDYSKHDQSASSFDTEDDAFFEFFSGDFSVSNSSCSGSDNIVFCGKLIPYRQPERVASDRVSGVESYDSRSKNPECVGRKRNRKLEKYYEFPAERAVVLESSPTKSRWFLFLFGSARFFPKEMELSEMRMRQRRSSPPAMWRKSEGKKTTVHGLWRVVRALVMGCSSRSDQNVAVKGSFSHLPVV